MSFGYGVGDVLAILKLIDRVRVEIRNYRGAPRHFQELQAALDLMKLPLSHVLHLTPDCPEGSGELEQIRAIAMHCQQPLLAFVDKMRPRESSLGHFRTAGTVAAVGARLHWSLVSRDDVQDLRKILLSEMLALTVMLGTYQLKYLQNLRPAITNELSKQSDQIASLSTRVGVLQELSRQTPSAIVDLRGIILSQKLETSARMNKLRRSCDNIGKRVKSLSLVAVAGQQVSRKMERALARLFAIISDVRRLLNILLECSGNVLEAVKRNAALLLEVQSVLRRIAEGIESIPLHLSLPIIRLDDALGVSWALPFQACTEYPAFRNMLQSVVFTDGRPGFPLVQADMFALSLAKSGDMVAVDDWSSAIKPGTHIQQAMIISTGREPGSAACSYPGCRGTMLGLLTTRSTREQSCDKCGRSSVVVLDDDLFESWNDLRDNSTLSFLKSKRNTPRSTPSPDLVRTNPETRSQKDSTKHSGTFSGTTPRLPSLDAQADPDDVAFFRRTLAYQSRAIQSVEEAASAIDNGDAKGHQFMGWWHLTQQPDNSAAIHHLRLAVELSQDQTGQTQYLLGRAYCAEAKVTPSKLNEILRATYHWYQKSIHLRSRSPSTWISIAQLYYLLNQYRDSIDALSRAIRMNPLQWISWYNLGVLYDAVGQTSDAADAFTRSFELNPDCSRAKRRAARLDECTRLGQTRTRPVKAEMVEPPLDHVSQTLPERLDNLDVVLNPIDSDWDDARPDDDYDSVSEGRSDDEDSESKGEDEFQEHADSEGYFKSVGGFLATAGSYK